MRVAIRINKNALRLGMTVLAVVIAGCAKLPSFTISAREQTRAEQALFERQAGELEAKGIHGAFPPTRWSHGECHWTQEPSVAVCRTRVRSRGAKKWTPLMMAYRREVDGSWTYVGPRSLLGN
jgi:hypothetical protein